MIKNWIEAFSSWSKNDKYIFITFTLLTVIFAINHTIALRMTLEAIIILFAIHKVIKDKSIIINKPFFIALLIMAWVTFHTFFISYQPEYSLTELNSQKIRPLLLFFAAYILSQGGKEKPLLTSFIVGLAIIIFTHSVTALYEGIDIGSIPKRFTIMGHEKHDISLINNLFYGIVLSCFIATLLLKWDIKKERNLLLKSFSFYFLLTILLLVQINARNGFIGFISLTLTILAFTLYGHFKKINIKAKVASVSLLIFLLLGMFTLSVTTDTRWKHFISSAKYALTIDTFTEYKGFSNWRSPPPFPIDESAFDRVTMIKEGISLTFKYPMGYSVGRATYDKIMKEDYGVKRHQATHSGLLDWTLETGYIGLFLWLALLFSIFQPAFLGWYRQRTLFDLLTCVIVIGFFSRSLFDSIVMRTHFFEMFMFILGILSRTLPQKTSLKQRKNDK